jgi:hypothetical protein
MVLGVVHQCREYFEGSKAHSVAGMSEKIVKNSFKTFWTDHLHIKSLLQFPSLPSLLCLDMLVAW